MSRQRMNVARVALLLLLTAAVLLSAWFVFHRTRSAQRPARPAWTQTVRTPSREDVAAAKALQAACPFAAGFKGDVGIFAKSLTTGQTYELNATRVFPAASTIKVPVSVVVYRHFYDTAGLFDQIAYDFGVHLMLTVSDNEYFALFLDEIEESIGPEKVRDLFAALGMQHTTLRDPQARETYGYSNVTTARDMAVLFEQLYRGNLVGAEKTQYMLDAMAHSIFSDEMERYLTGRRVIHKIGDLDDVLADVGIVEGPLGAVLLSIFTTTSLEQDYASDYIAAVSACLYSGLSGDPAEWNIP